MPQIVELGAEFHAYSPYREFAFDREASAAFIGRLIEHGAVFLSDRGVIGGVLNPLYFNPSILMAAELFWWAHKGGTALREAFEQWARDEGAMGVQFSGLADEREATIRKVFARAGYAPTELGFCKRF